MGVVPVIYLLTAQRADARKERDMKIDSTTSLFHFCPEWQEMKHCDGESYVHPAYDLQYCLFAQHTDIPPHRQKLWECPP